MKKNEFTLEEVAQHFYDSFKAFEAVRKTGELDYAQFGELKEHLDNLFSYGNLFSDDPKLSINQLSFDEPKYNSDKDIIYVEEALNSGVQDKITALKKRRSQVTSQEEKDFLTTQMKSLAAKADLLLIDD